MRCCMRCCIPIQSTVNQPHFSIFYSCFCYSDWLTFSILSSRSFIQSVSCNMMLIFLMCFSFQLLYPSALFFFFFFFNFQVLFKIFVQQKPTQHCKIITFQKKKKKRERERRFSLCSFILSPNLVIILTTISLDSLSLKLFISLSLGFFQGFFTLFFHLKQVAPHFHFVNFLFFCETR